MRTPTIAFGRAISHPKLQQTFAALKHRNFKLWFIGQSSSLIGTWAQTTAQAFLIFQLTHSPTYLGLVGFATGLPSLLFMLFGGVLADRMSRRRLLFVTQTWMMLLAFLLAFLTFSGWVRPWQVLALAFLLGVANAFDTPARQAFIPEIVGRDDLANAIALNSVMFQLATVIGPAVGGIIYALFGPAWCFTVNGLSFLIVISALWWMNVETGVPRARLTSAWQELQAGLRYVSGHKVIRTVITLVCVSSIFGLGYGTLFPQWAVEVLGGDATTNGWLQSARGAGSLLGAFMIAWFGRFGFKGKLLTTGSFVFPLALILFAQTRTLLLSLAALFVVGWGYMVLFNMSNLQVQMQVQDGFRGRVMSLYSMAYWGLMPIGSLIAGISAEQLGAPLTVQAGAVITMIFALSVWVLVPQIRALE